MCLRNFYKINNIKKILQFNHFDNNVFRFHNLNIKCKSKFISINSLPKKIILIIYYDPATFPSKI